MQSLSLQQLNEVDPKVKTYLRPN